MTTTGIAVATCPMIGGRMRGSRSLLWGENRDQRGGKAFAFRRGRKCEKTPSSPSPEVHRSGGLSRHGETEVPLGAAIGGRVGGNSPRQPRKKFGKALVRRVDPRYGNLIWPNRHKGRGVANVYIF